MKPKVYLETSVPSYLTAWISPNLVMAAQQQVTREWWDNSRSGFDLFISGPVLEEAGAGDPEAAARRLAILQELPVLEATESAVRLAGQLLRRLRLPDRAAYDALHIAIAAAHGLDYLLTWNCKHIANASNQLGIAAACRDAGVAPPVICTPHGLRKE